MIDDIYFRVLVKDNTMDEDEFTDWPVEFLQKYFEDLEYKTITVYSDIWIPTVHELLQGRKEVIKLSRNKDGTFYPDQNGEYKTIAPRGDKPFTDNNFFKREFKIAGEIVSNVLNEENYYKITSKETFNIYNLTSHMIIYLQSIGFGSLLIDKDYGRLNQIECFDDDSDVENEYESFWVIKFEIGMP